ncbi:hypothetical protein ACQP3D_31015, partial [Escherichia coli]
SKFQNSQGDTEKLCLKNQTKTNIDINSGSLALEHFFETGFHCITTGDLEVTKICLLRADIEGMHQHAPLLRPRIVS